MPLSNIFIARSAKNYTLLSFKPLPSKQHMLECVLSVSIGRSIRRKNDFDAATSSTDENDDNTDIFRKLTRSGSALKRIISAIESIENQTAIFTKDSMECILDCGRNKAMLLLPCQHQHTCKECWLIWKMQSLKRITKEVLNSSHYDDNIMQPKCPMCRQPVDKEIVAYN